MALLIRPVTKNDHAAVLELARLAGIGFTSLPPDAGVLEEKIAGSVLSFQGTPRNPHEENFLFVLEDTDTGKLAGTTALYAHVGLTRPFYSYKLSTITQASRDLGIYSLQRVLHMVNDYTGAAEVGSLFLAPDYRRDGIGRFLSRCRFLMLADFPELFSETVISEIRGVQDENGDSPFYNNLARHFFQMEFKRADYIHATQGGQFIADLMPKYPIYVELLSKEAREVIGKPFTASLPAMRMLEAEGFRHQGYIDVFDAGPTIEVKRDQIRTVRQSVRAVVTQILTEVVGETHMIANGQLPDYRMTRASVQLQDAGATITRQTADVLGVKLGDTLRVVL